MFKTYYHNIFYITYSKSPLINVIKLESRETFRTASFCFYGIQEISRLKLFVIRTSIFVHNFSTKF